MRPGRLIGWAVARVSAITWTRRKALVTVAAVAVGLTALGAVRDELAARSAIVVHRPGQSCVFDGWGAWRHDRHAHRERTGARLWADTHHCRRASWSYDFVSDRRLLAGERAQR